MPAEDDDHYQEDLRYLRSRYPDDRFISYVVPPGEKTGGMKVRYIIRVVSGDRAREIDARQAKAIMAVLQSVRDRRDQREQANPASGKTADNASQ
jgi:hypothetical protein